LPKFSANNSSCYVLFIVRYCINSLTEITIISWLQRKESMEH